MNINNDSDFYAPTYDGSPGWVWGGGDAGWSYQGTTEGHGGTSTLAQTLMAGLQQQQSPPQEDWFARANSMAMAAMVAAQTSSASTTPAPVSTGHDAGLGALGLDAVAYSPSEAYTPPPAAQNIFNASPAEGWVWGGGDAGWNYQPSSNDLLSTAITAAWNHEQQTAAHVASIATAGSTLGALANGLLTEQAAANGSNYNPSDKSLGTIKTGVNPPVTAGAATTQSAANSNAGTLNTLTRVDTPPRPQARTGELWEGGQGVATLWNQYQADPYRLMQSMAEYGVSAQEIAQASGQSLDDINAYLSRAGAPVGFAGANIIDRDAVDRAFLAALDEASQAGTPPGMGSTFDVQAFSVWYAAQDTQASREFARLHGANFSQSQAIAVAGQWQGGGDSGLWVWQGGQLARQGQTESSQSQIANYLSYSQASATELQSVDFMLGDQINQELLTHFGSDIPLPNSEYVERMRARYGSQRAEQMYRIMQASGEVRQTFAAAVNAQQIQQPWPEEIQAQSTAPGVQLNHQETQYTSASQPWWSVTHHVEHDNTYSTVNFNLQAYTDWYAAQNTPASRLFEQLYGSQLTTVEHRENRGEGDIHEWSNTYIGAGGASEILLGNYQASGDQGERWEQAHATDYGISAHCVAMDGDMKLFDAGAITFDPVMGFVTDRENINTSDWTDMIVPVFVGAVAGAFLGPLAAQGVGLGGSTIAAVGFGGAIGSAFSSLMATGSIDFEQVIKSALTAVLTAGFAELTNANQAGLLTDARGNVVFIDGLSVVNDWGTRIAGMGAQAAFSGIVSDLMGGDFSQGFVQSMANQLGQEIMNAVNGEIRNSSTPLTVHEQAAYNLMGRGLSAALTIAANPDNPMQALALSFVSSIGAGVGNAVGNVNPAANGVGNTNGTPPINWSNTPVNGLTEDDGYAMGAGGGESAAAVPLPNASTPELTEADQTVPPPVISGMDSGGGNGTSLTNYNNGVPPGPNLRWTDAGWQAIEAVDGGVQEGMVASAGSGQTRSGANASLGATSTTGGTAGITGTNIPELQQQMPWAQRGVLLNGVDVAYRNESQEAVAALANQNYRNAEILATAATQLFQAGNVQMGNLYLAAALNYQEAGNYASERAAQYVDGRSIPRQVVNPPAFQPNAQWSFGGANSAGLSAGVYTDNRSQSALDTSLDRTTTVLGTSPVWVPAVVLSVAYSPLGFALGAVGDAAGQYYQNGEVRLSQSVFSGVTGAGAFSLAAHLPAITSWGSGALTVGGNATIGGATAVANTSFNNVYYQEETSLYDAGRLGAGFSAGGTLFGNWTSRFLTTLMPSAAHIPVSGTPWTIPAQGTLNIAPVRIGNTVSNTIGAVPAFIPLDNGVKKDK